MVKKRIISVMGTHSIHEMNRIFHTPKPQGTWEYQETHQVNRKQIMMGFSRQIKKLEYFLESMEGC